MRKRASALLLFCLLASAAAFPADPPAAPRVVALPSRSPLVTFRVVFLTGAASDPVGQQGVSALTASMLAEGGSREMTYKQIVEAMFPMATNVSSQVDKEMTTFSAVTHVENLDKFYSLFRAMLLDPGWREDDFKRLKDDAINYLRVSLRGNNDEELGKEVLYNTIYAGHPYGWHNAGAASTLEKLTVEDLRRFYRSNYTRANVILGIAGGYTPAFLERMKKDFAALPAITSAGRWPAAGQRSSAGLAAGGEAGSRATRIPPPKAAPGMSLTVVDKNTRSVAISMGFPISVRRGDPDYPALLVMQSYFGQHRNSGGVLYQRIRESRGINYGNYVYIEYFPRGMFLFEPEPNLGRSQQIFQVWIRPVEPPAAHFTLRLALHELDKLVTDGLKQEDFERTRSFLTKNVNLLTRTKEAELGYAIDSQYYGIPDYNSYVKKALASLTREQVNQAIRKHLNPANLQIVAITANGEEFKQKILGNAASPITYNSPKPNLAEEDNVVSARRIDLKPEAVRVIPVARVFE